MIKKIGIKSPFINLTATILGHTETQIFMKRWHYFLIGFLLIYLGKINPIGAHGANINYKMTKAIQIEALYADGKPMKAAQVVVYAPNDPTTPWLQGTTNQAGQFTFTPDVTQTGNWDVKVRQAGHGDIISIPLTTDNTSSIQLQNSSQNTGYTPLQKVVMAATGVWGFLGTALFFSRNKAHS
ncbi:MAG: carboxypeptidase regulatory-like domain-containing protein [Microcystaceae cyanobacterium]